MRHEVISFLEQKASKSMVDDGGAAPMDLDYVQGKGKGKGTKTCYTCGKVGHVSKDCWHGKSKGTSSSSTSKGSSSKGSSTGKGTKGSKGSPKGKGKSSKGKGKGKMGSKPGKQYAVENQEETQQWSEEPEAEGQETWNQETWPNQDGQWEEQTGEQGAICVASAASAQQAPIQRPLTKYEKALEGEQLEFMKGKIWKSPAGFWNMPFRLVCNQSCYEARFYCGYQRCKHKGFTTPSQFKQHMMSKVGTDGHPDQDQIDAWENDPYVVPEGRRHYGLWDRVTGNMLNAKIEVWDPEPLWKAIQKSKERMKANLFSGKPSEQGAAEAEKKKTVLMKAAPKQKPEKFGSKHVEEVDDSSEYTIDSEDIEEGESEAYEERDEEVQAPEENEEEVKASEEKEEEVKAPEENEEDLQALREEKSKALTKKREEKESLQKKPVGFTPGAVAKFTQALIMQKLEEIKSIEGTLVLLDRSHPARTALEETIAQKKEEIEKIKNERPKARERKHSARQEMDKREAGPRVAYIKERQRKRAAEHRKSGAKARAIANVAKQEEAEERFNQLGSGRKVKTFPLAEGELSKEVQAAPVSKKEKTFIKDEQDEEFPEVKRRRMELPPGEKRRLEEKKAKFKEDKASKKSKSQQKKKEDQLLKELKEESAKKKKKQEEKKEKPIVTPEEQEEAEVQALLAEVGKPSEKASGSAGSAHQDRWSKAGTSKYYGGSSKGWSSKWKSSWDKQSYWEHDQWKDSYGSGRGSEQPKTPGKGPKKDKESEANEDEENLEETPKRPKINFEDRRVAGPLRISKGRMGPPSSEESQEDDEAELEGLEPTDDELREGPNEEDEEIDPAEDEEESGQRGQMPSFGPPSKLPPRRDGPEGSNWCRVDFIVDGGASDNALPLGVLPGIPMKPPQGFKDFALADGRIIPNLGQKVVQIVFQCGLVLTGTFSVVDSAKPLLSVGKMTNLGHTVKMTPEGGQIVLKNGKSIKIYYRNGVWKIPTWIWCPGDGKEDASFQGQGDQKVLVCKGSSLSVRRAIVTA